MAYVVSRNKTEQRPIDLGESNDRMVEVVSGLREHERVSLTEPPGAAATREARPAPNALQPR